MANAIRTFAVGSGSFSVWWADGSVYVAGCFDYESEAEEATKRLAAIGVSISYRETDAGWSLV